MTGSKPTYIEGTGWRRAVRHHQHRRHHAHNYSAVGTYLITITISEAVRDGEDVSFGKIIGNVRARKGEDGFAALNPSSLGLAVYNEELCKISKVYPMVNVWHFCLMPDHIHMILRVNSPLPAKKHLGHVVGAFMGGISRAWWRLQDEGLMPKRSVTPAPIGSPDHAAMSISQAPVSLASASDNRPASSAPGRPAEIGAQAMAPVSLASASDNRPALFADGYSDHILMRDGQLANWKEYLDDNPHRLLIRQCFPDIMERSLCITIAGTRYSAFGNFALLKRPEKVQGQCHVWARYGDLTPAERGQYGFAYPCAPDYKTRIPYEDTHHFREKYSRTMASVTTGYAVLVTPGISEGEKRMKNEAIEKRLPLIHLQKDPITPRWKPEKSRFYACAEGSLLILAPWQDDMGTEGYYATFHKLNDLAAALCALDTGQLSACQVSIAE